MMSHGYKPELSEGAVKPPLFQTYFLYLKMQRKEKLFLN